ncbi:growth/differentiation factor 15 [Choloepus didactylus]|uniref:growth/differentiation factor 15 n=1 Tax=Choloepus didactylus TaxID=27675 RepID=UPI00189C8560|nr:growth/differentiation factor 15 [Choloepus didactylus]
MARREPTPPPLSRLLLLLLLPRLLRGAAAPRAPQPRAGPAGPPDASLVERELRRGLEDVLSRLRGNQSREDSHPDPGTASAVRILTPQLRSEPGGHVLLRIARTALSAGLPAVPRLHRALLWLSPTAPRPLDVTRPLQRQLGLGGPSAPALRLRLPLPSDLPSDLRSMRPRLELHQHSPASRRRRAAHASEEADCPQGAGRCCRVQSRRVTLEELGWDDWVLAPRDLDVRFCVGACPRHFRPASAHAQIKARLHGLDPRAAPAPCCVPASYDPLVVLRRDSDGGVTFTPFDDLLAKSCHCA